jgi:p-hydroxybenzoate 3-monooxygenase
MAGADLRTQVAIIGAGPPGMLLLDADGVLSIVLETRSQEYVASRIRAGILEQSTVDLLRSCGLGERLDQKGDCHRGTYLHGPAIATTSTSSA